MSTLAERAVAALDAHKGVLLPAIQSLMEQAWEEGYDAGWESGNESAKWFAPEKPANPYAQQAPQPVNLPRVPEGGPE